jgi:predicted  nucleic acid-binding Zn-ribbon protein
VESLKNCLNSTRGQGRYLQIVFPDEMKAVRTGIDVIGREINEITAALADYRKEKSLIDSVMKAYNALIDIDIDREKAAGKDQRIKNRITEISDRITAIEKEMKTILSDQRMSEITGLEAALRETESQRDTEARTYAALSMTASHVFRKAEKIAVKQKHSAEIAILRHMMELLSDHDIPDGGELQDTLALACPIAERMISTGEIQLKNREERAIFSDASQFTRDICASCIDLMTRNETCKIALDKLDSHPLQVRAKSLEREKNQLETMLTKEQKAREELEEWRSKTEDRIPALQSELKEIMKNLAGKGTVVQING